jgi:glucosamine-6-phosphate isomerase/6-phosphogluconolactonase
LHDGKRHELRSPHSAGWRGHRPARRADNAAHVIFMVTGANKAPALAAVLERVYEPDQLPAQLIRPANGTLLWLVDTAAGGLLTRAIRE